jgi:hypothetical protein
MAQKRADTIEQKSCTYPGASQRCTIATAPSSQVNSTFSRSCQHLTPRPLKDKEALTNCQTQRMASRRKFWKCESKIDLLGMNSCSQVNCQMRAAFRRNKLPRQSPYSSQSEAGIPIGLTFQPIRLSRQPNRLSRLPSEAGE